MEYFVERKPLFSEEWTTAASTSVASENISEEKAKKGLPPLVAALPKQILKVYWF